MHTSSRARPLLSCRRRRRALRRRRYRAGSSGAGGHELQRLLFLGHQPRGSRGPGHRPDQPVPRRQGSLAARGLGPPHGILGMEVAPHGRQHVLRSQRPGTTHLAHRVPAREGLRVRGRVVGREHRLGLPDGTVGRGRLARLPRPQGEHRERELHLHRRRRRRNHRRPALLDTELRRRRRRQPAPATHTSRHSGARPGAGGADVRPAGAGGHDAAALRRPRPPRARRP